MASSYIETARRRRRWPAVLLGGAVAAALAGLVAAAALHVHEPIPAVSAPVSGLARMQNVHTNVLRSGKPSVEASAAEVQLEHLHAFGPFRIGVMRAARARDLNVEIAETTSPTADVLAHSIEALLPGGKNVVQATADGVHVRRKVDGRIVLDLQAKHCATRWRRLDCQRGRLSLTGQPAIDFQHAAFEAGMWTLDGKLRPAPG